MPAMGKPAVAAEALESQLWSIQLIDTVKTDSTKAPSMLKKNVTKFQPELKQHESEKSQRKC